MYFRKSSSFPYLRHGGVGGALQPTRFFTIIILSLINDAIINVAGNI